MTQSIEEAARDVVRKHYPEMRDDYKGRRLQVAVECIKLGREQAAGLADDYRTKWDMRGDFKQSDASRGIAQAIRALP